MTGPIDTDGGTQAIAFAENSRGELRLQGGNGQVSPQLSAGGGKPGQGLPAVVKSGGDTPLSVRRITPREAERLQGFPDDFTLIDRGQRRPFANRAALKDEVRYLRTKYPEIPVREVVTLAADGPRYRALGNSMAVPVVAYLLRRIERSRAMLAHTQETAE